MLTKIGNREFTRLYWIEMGCFVSAGKFLAVDFSLEFHEGVEQRFGPRRTPGKENVHRNKAGHSFQYVIPLLEGSTRDRASAHRNYVFRVWHLVVEPDNLWRHLLGHRSGHNHQVRLSW